MEKKFVSEQTRKAIIQMRSDGRGPQQISEILGINPSTISKIYNRHLHRTQQSSLLIDTEMSETATYAELRQTINHLTEINNLLKEHIQLLKSLR